jgi:hypothetical protein
MADEEEDVNEQQERADARLRSFFALEEGATPASAAARYTALQRLYARVGPPTTAEVERIGNGRACLVSLERPDGTPVRTTCGRPVIAQRGVCLRGRDADAWIRQFLLAQDRLAPSIGADEVPRPVVVLDAGARMAAGEGGEWYVPPGYLAFLRAQPHHAHIHVVGLSEAARAFARLLLAPLPAALTARVALHAGYEEALAPLLRAEDRPVEWGGAMPWDLDAHREAVRAAFPPAAARVMPWWRRATAEAKK